MNINEFKKEITQSKPMLDNRFDVEIYIPNVMRDRWGNGETKTLKTFTKALNMGGRNLTTSETVMGKLYQLPYGDQYNDITMNFMLDDKYLTKSLFDDWQDKINPRKSSVLKAFYRDYVTTMKISHKNDMGIERQNFTLIDVFPSIVGDIQLSKDSTNQPAIITVTFSYRYWESN